MRKWQQVEALVRDYIDNKRLQEGDEIPSDADLAKMAGCSLQPVIRAMQELERRGLIRRRAGAASKVRLPQEVLLEQEFSFSRSAAKLGERLETRILELTPRLPNQGELYAYEERAQKALGLKKEQPFCAIARLRLIDGAPRAIHRAYINPALFPADFRVAHDFESESLLDAYAASGLQLRSRDTTLRARFALECDIGILRLADPKQPILEAEQVLRGIVVETGAPVNIEYLFAWYVDWDYHIRDRRAS